MVFLHFKTNPINSLIGQCCDDFRTASIPQKTGMILYVPKDPSGDFGAFDSRFGHFKRRKKELSKLGG
jgi:hypothetical protein